MKMDRKDDMFDTDYHMTQQEFDDAVIELHDAYSDDGYQSGPEDFDPLPGEGLGIYPSVVDYPDTGDGNFSSSDLPPRQSSTRW